MSEARTSGNDWLADEIERQNDTAAVGKVGVFLTPAQWLAVVTRLRALSAKQPKEDGR